MESDDLTEELKQRARTCETTADLIELAQSESIVLTDGQLEAISGGWRKPCDSYCTFFR